MANVPTFKNPNTLGFFSLATLFNSAIDRDWSKGYAEQWEVELPAPTLGDIAEHAADLLSVEQAAKAETDPYDPAPKDLAEEFEQSDGFDSFRDGFDPMMSYAWPVALGYEVDSREAARLMAIFAPSTTLVARSHDADGEPLDEVAYEIALNGGGMYLGDHIAAAYLCCGAMPPIDLLRDLRQAGHSYVLPRLPLAEVYAQAQKHLRHLADGLGEELTRLEELTAEKAAQAG